MKIGIVGGGIVGRATARSYLEFAEVMVYDVMRERSTHTLNEVLQAGIVFCCLPTPQQQGSLRADTSAIEDFFREQRGSDGCFVLRSTVPIGTTARLRQEYQLTELVHSPEFLTARTASTEAQLPSRNIIGGTVCECAMRLQTLYERRFPGVPVHLMTSDESEAVKLIQNGLFAVKVSYLNEVSTLCERFSLSWERVLAGVLADGRICHAHTRVPGPDGRRGFGGGCLSKDLSSLVACIEAAGLGAEIGRAALLRNERDRGPEGV